MTHSPQTGPTCAEPGTARRGRPPKGTAQLSRDGIVEATLKVIDADGIAAVSMRSVARTLGVDAKSLYNHVDGKDGLLDAVAEHLLGGIALPDLTGDFATDLRAVADAFRARALLHPEAVTLVITRQVSSLAALAPVEAMLAVLRGAGCPVGEAVQLLRLLVAALVGILLRGSGPGRRTASSRRAASPSAAPCWPAPVCPTWRRRSPSSRTSTARRTTSTPSARRSTSSCAASPPSPPPPPRVGRRSSPCRTPGPVGVPGGPRDRAGRVS
jgi:AcrR family transcriptional regulator